jgi:hypothetical protein
MRWNLRQSAVCAILALVILRCSNEPNVIISIPELAARVYGTVSPAGPETHVLLVSNGRTIDSLDADPGTGQFSFVGVDYGLYTSVATRGDSGTRAYFSVDGRFHNLSRLLMTPARGALRWAQFYSGDTIRSSHVTNDSVFSIEFSFNDWAVLDSQPVSITPSRLANNATSTNSGASYHALAFSLDSLFSVPRASLTLRFQATDPRGEVLADSVVFSYAIDSTGLDRALTDRLVSRVYAADSNIIRTRYGRHLVTLPNRENRIAVVFARTMNTGSVEQSISIAPRCVASFFWSADTLTIAPANSLMSDTTYTITIGAEAMTADSTHFRCPYSITVDSYDPSFFYNYWPLDSAQRVDTALPFVFKSSYAVEPISLQNTFSIVPTVDSMVFESTGPGAVRVRHAALLPGTTYQITIAGSLVSRMGTELGNDLVVTFTTVSQ